MREIKFRAWHTLQNVMFSAEELGTDQMTLSVDGRGFVNVSGRRIDIYNDAEKREQGFNWKHIKDACLDSYFFSNSAGTGEVIGNIYENGSLLEKIKEDK